MDEKELPLLLLLATSCCQLLLFEEMSKKRKRRKIWVKEWLRKRNTLGAYKSIISEFQLQDRYSCCKYLRMNCETFKESWLFQEYGREMDIHPRLSRLICVINRLLFSFNSAFFEGQFVSSVFRGTFTRASNLKSFKNIISWESFN